MSQGGSHKRYTRRQMAEINVVPYIDVMLVLLVIFMITAPLLAQGVKVELPQAAAEVMDQSKGEPVVVTVDERGTLYMNIGDDPNKPVQPDTVVARVAAVLRNKPHTEILVRGDHSASYGEVVHAMVLLQQAGAPNVGLITQSPEAKIER
ncbi:MAG: protein TolR [Gammaproteobacteria bacterium SG8_47]|nr:MAG: protein TolR [Gammaproteobacteria bacterium SG8_47]